MEKQKKNSYEEISRRVDSVRRIYSQIGEPLPVDVMIDLYRHLADALAMAQEREDKKSGKKRMRQ